MAYVHIPLPKWCIVGYLMKWQVNTWVFVFEFGHYLIRESSTMTSKILYTIRHIGMYRCLWSDDCHAHGILGCLILILSNSTLNSDLSCYQVSWITPCVITGFPQLLKNHWNSDLFQDHGKIIEFHEKLLKFVEMKKSWKNHWILDQSLMEKSLNSEIGIVLTNYMGK